MWRMPTEIQEIDTDNLQPYEGEEAQVILLCNPIGWTQPGGKKSIDEDLQRE